MSQFAYYASSKKCNNNNNNNVNESTCSSLKIGDKVDVFTNSFIRNETEEKNHFCEAFVKEVNETTYKIGFYGMAENLDEVIDKDSERIQRHGTRSSNQPQKVPLVNSKVVSYQPTSYNAREQLLSISSMESYQKNSQEEIRLGDYYDMNIMDVRRQTLDNSKNNEKDGLDNKSLHKRKNYLDQHPDLNAVMRARLIEWLAEVCHEYQYRRETLYTASAYVDSYLSIKENAKRSKLQLIGCAGLFLAGETLENYPLSILELVVLTDLTYDETELSTMVNLMRFMKINETTPRTIMYYMSLYINTILTYSCTKKKKRSLVQCSKKQYDRMDRYLTSCNDSESVSNRKYVPSYHALAEDLMPEKDIGCFTSCNYNAFNMFPKKAFQIIMNQVDLLLLDIQSLEFPPELIASTMLYHYLPVQISSIKKHNVLEATGSKLKDILTLSKWLGKLLYRFDTLKIYDAKSEKVIWRQIKKLEGTKNNLLPRNHDLQNLQDCIDDGLHHFRQYIKTPEVIKSIEDVKSINVHFYKTASSIKISVSSDTNLRDVISSNLKSMKIQVGRRNPLY